MICSNCQHKNRTEAKFCEACGNKLMHACPACGHELRPSAKFCDECGIRLQGKEPETQLPKAPGPAPAQKKQAERRQLTVLFCDLVGSTALSDQLDAEEFRQVILDYQQVAETVIRRYGGHVAQYLGDGLLVYFGYPKGLEDAPRVGVRAGLGILEAVGHANADWKAQGRIAIDVRIGIHTGLVVVDDFLALGDTVNIAARLEGLAPENGLVISAQTMKLVKGWFEVQSLGEAMLKGIKEPMQLYRVLHESGARSRLEAVRGFGLSPVVGREKEQFLLTHAWEQVKKEQGQVVLLSGEAGIGKSRLVEDTKQLVAGEADAWLIELYCAPHFQNAPFHPLIDGLEQVALQFEKTDTSEIKRTKLEGFLLQAGLDLPVSLPLMADLLSIPLETSTEDQIQGAEQKKQTIATIAKIIQNRAARQPVLLVIEDLHWADPSTLEWVDVMLEQLSDQSILMLCTTRPQFQPHWMALPSVQTVILERLSADDIEALCYHQTQGKTLPREVLAQIKSKTDGVPLFVEELSRMIIESGMVNEEEDHYILADKMVPMAIPATLQDSLLARLDRLSPVKETIQTGAVLGREFSFELLTAVTEKNREELQHELARLVEAGLLYQKGSPLKLAYMFKHALIQDTAYDSLLNSRRQQLHQKVARVLEKQFPEAIAYQPELLAHHQTGACLAHAAILNWKKAGQQARKRYANKEAINYLKRGLTLTPQLDDHSQALNLEFELYYLLNQYLFTEFGFSHPELKESNEKLVERALELGRSNEIFMYQIALIMGVLVGGNFDVQEKLDDLLTMAKTSGDDFSIAAIHGWTGLLYLNKGDYLLAKMHLENAINLYDPGLHESLKQFNGSNLRVESGAHYLMALQLLGYPDQARKQLSFIRNLATELGNPQDLFLLYTFFSNLHIIRREFSEVMPVIEKGLTSLKGSEDSFMYQLFDMNRNNALAGMGDPEAASRAYELAVHLRRGFKVYNGPWFSHLIETFKWLGLPEKGLEVVEDALAGMQITGERFCLPNLYRVKGDFLLMLNKPEAEAEQLYLKAIAISKEQSTKWHELLAAKSLARLWQSQGKVKEAYDLLHGVYSWFTEGFDTVDMREAKELLASMKTRL